MKFLYPSSRQFPFDEVTEKIVRELEKRNWQAPGIEVEFRDYGPGFRKVQYIRSQDFKLLFYRVQGTMSGGSWNDTAGVGQINIPTKEITVYDDESGPTLYLYVGSNWERDQQGFVNSLKVNSKLSREPKTYLQYRGECLCRGYDKHRHTGFRSPFLIHTNDLGREYDPEGDEPLLFNTAEVMKEFKRYLEDVVLKQIVSHSVTA